MQQVSKPVFSANTNSNFLRFSAHFYFCDFDLRDLLFRFRDRGTPASSRKMGKGGFRINLFAAIRT